MKRLPISLLCCALLAAVSPARAEGARHARAEALGRRAQTLLDAGHVTQGCALFEESQRLESKLGTVLKLGDCYQLAGRTASAWHTFLEAEAIARNEKKLEEEQRATSSAAALAPQLTHVVLLVPNTSRVPGLAVKLGANTIPEADWGSSIAVDPGALEVSAAAKGHSPWRVTVDASAAGGAEYRVHVPTLSPARAVSSNRGSSMRTAGVLTGSLGLAGIGAGAVFNALSRSGEDAASCAKGVLQCSPSDSKRNAYSDVATASFAIGSALFATGVTLFVLSPSPDRQEQHSLRVAARAAPSGGRLQLEGAW
jgi:hypothetical protein